VVVKEKAVVADIRNLRGVSSLRVRKPVIDARLQINSSLNGGKNNVQIN
jgi:hypothetical protein